MPRPEALPPQRLHPHPDPAPGALRELCVYLYLERGALRLDYQLHGDAAELALPRTEPATRRDGLWQHTCCELFVQGDDAPAYREFNFSPAGPWQAYAFSTYRQGGVLARAQAPDIVTERRADGLHVSVRLPRANLPPGRRLRLGLTAVAEARDASLSYWALAHAPGKPDFHHPDTFALILDLPDQTP